jgi:parallel beta-helix repeat protein
LNKWIFKNSISFHEIDKFGERMKHLTIVFTMAMLLLSTTIAITIAISYSNVTVTEAYAMIKSNPNLVILDVRTQSEYDLGHIRLAIHIPLDEISGRLFELNITDEILVYCKAGGRSASASQILVDNGFLYVFNILGGLDAWKIQGYPVYIKYPSIQEAINNAAEGDSIYVSVGTYYENVEVNKTISLIGENKYNTIVDGNGSNVFSLRTNNITISQFKILNGYRGISSNDDSWNCTIYRNNIVNNQYGILADGWFWCISENCIESNAINGVYIDGSYTRVSNNKIRGNGFDGVWLLITDWNVVVGNTISDNNCGIAFSSAISFNCRNNAIYHNNFLNNTFQVDLGNSANTTFDDGCEGNYWDDYGARYPNASCNEFGIWNTSYTIEGYTLKDNYPLKSPYWNPADINHDLEVDIFDIVSACSAYKSTSTDMNWNCHCDIAEPYGIIDIFDIVKICVSYGEEYT